MTVSAAEQQCSESTARNLFDQLRQASKRWDESAVRYEQDRQIVRDLVIEIWQRRAWAVAGYDSWEAAVAAEVPQLREVRLPRQERRELVAEFTDAGMSTRAVGTVLGVDQKTVVNDRRGEEFSSPDPEPETQAEIIPVGQLEFLDAEIVHDVFEPETDAPDMDDAPEPAKEPESEQEPPAPPPPPARNVVGIDGKTYRPTPRPRPVPQPVLAGERLARYDGEKRSEDLGQACQILALLAHPAQRRAHIEAWRDYPEGASPSARKRVGPDEFRAYATVLLTLAEEWESEL